MPETNIVAADHERRFGGLTRLFGPDCLETLQKAHVLVAGLGGVGSWCAEALVRSGVGKLTLVDLDHIAESNINRQLHALGSTVGQAKVEAMAARLADINPACKLHAIDDFVTPDNVADLLADQPEVLIDCTDQVAAKVAMVVEADKRKLPIIVCGGAGGKTDLLSLRAGDLSAACHDALLARVRTQLRRRHGYASGAMRDTARSRRRARMGVTALWVDQPVRLPEAWQTDAGIPMERASQGLSCAGYGSVVTITAGMGLAAANLALDGLLSRPD